MTVEGPAAAVPVRTATTAAGAGVWVRENWALLAVLAAFAAAAAIVPTFTAIATTDDWAYTRSAQVLISEGRLTIFPVVAATAVFQIAWGALFALIFGPTFGAFRLSTVVITALGALALYGLCRELGVSRGRGALGAATFLFNPLVFVLAFTFMTDGHFAALLTIATWLYARAVGADGMDGHFVVAASGVTALAFLTRQQGALIVPAVLVFLLVTRRLRFDRGSLVLLLQIVTLPLLAAVGYAAWLRFGNDLPWVQGSFFREVLEEGWSGTWWLLRRLTVVELIYLGFFTLPLMAAVLPFLWGLIRDISRRGWLVFALWAAIAIVGVVDLWRRGSRMPYVAQFFGAGGLGAPDVLGSRPILLNAEMRGALTAVCLIASLVLALVAARVLSLTPTPLPSSRERGLLSPDGLPSREQISMSTHPSPGSTGEGLGMRADRRGQDDSGHPVVAPSDAAIEPESLLRSRAGLVLSIAVWQVLGVMPPSYHYIGWAAGSLDRYLLPLVPLAIALAMWGLRGARMALPVGWVVIAALAVFSVAGTRDYLVYMREVWAMGSQAVAAGVPLDRLDAGSGWDGYYLYEYGRENHIRSRTPKGGPWWVYFYAPATDSSYVVAGKPLQRHLTVFRRPYSSWLQRQPTFIYLVRRWGVTWPPRPEPRPIVTRPGPGGLVTVPPAALLPTVAPVEPASADE